MLKIHDLQLGELSKGDRQGRLYHGWSKGDRQGRLYHGWSKGDRQGRPYNKGITTILSEFMEGFDALAAIPPSVAIFGSAREA